MLKVIKGFKYAYRGVDVKEYVEGAEIPDGDECEAVALKEKWVKRVKAKAPEKAPAPEPEDDKKKDPANTDPAGDGGGLPLGDGDAGGAGKK